MTMLVCLDVDGCLIDSDRPLMTALRQPDTPAGNDAAATPVGRS